MPDSKRTDEVTIVLVGHCGPDAFMLRTAVQRIVPEAAVVVVNDMQTLEAQHRRPDNLWLVNRVLDGDFPMEGMDLIAGRPKDEQQPVMMLISNYTEAQDRAVQSGALPGFGKQSLYDEETAVRLRAAVDCALDMARTVEEN